jgi:hypothetical protein
MVIRLITDLDELVKLVLKGGGGKGEWVEEEVLGLLGFVALVCVWVLFCCSGGYLC